MDKYILIEDWYNIKKGTIIEPEDGVYKYNLDGNIITFNEETLKNETIFKIYEDMLTITNMDDLDIDGNEYNFRMQLDIKCNRSRLNEIEKFIRDNLDKILT